MKFYSKNELIEAIKAIMDSGWHKSVKNTKDTRNDGAVGNTLEKLLGINENNLPIPNANGWELKGQRLHTSSLITLKHINPCPSGSQIVSKILLPHYGWRHKKAGEKYPENEMSFRSTTSAVRFTNRGFKICVDRKEKKVKFIFDSSKADYESDEIKQWLKSVNERIGLGPINPEPYWGFDDLKRIIGAKLSNCFYVVADSKTIDSHEYFKYESLLILSGFSFRKFIKAIEKGWVFVEFDARTGHDHGTKFRLSQDYWSSLYSSITRVI